MDEVLFIGRVHSFVFSDQCMLYLIDVTLYSADATLYFSLWGVPMGFLRNYVRTRLIILRVYVSFLLRGVGEPRGACTSW